jgi:hypothetical protein
MMKRLIYILMLMVLSACGGSSGSGANANTNEAIAQRFNDAIFSGRSDDAKALAVPAARETVNAKVDTFATLYKKYDFREVKINVTRPWEVGTGTQESDKRVEVSFQFKDKQPDANWKIGLLYVRVQIPQGGSWGVSDLVLSRPLN